MSFTSAVNTAASRSSKRLRNQPRYPIYTQHKGGGFSIIPWSESLPIPSTRKIAQSIDRLKRVTDPALVIGASSYTQWTSNVMSYTPEERSLPCLANVEFPDWNEILSNNQAGTDNAPSSWETATAQTEFARYNAAEGTNWDYANATVAQYKAVTVKLWNDCASYWYANGGGRLINYGGSGVGTGGSFGSYGGLAEATRRADELPLPDGLNLTTQYMLEAGTWNYSFKSLSEFYTAGGRASSWLRAQENAQTYGHSTYCFFPTNGRAVSNISNWSMKGNNDNDNISTFLRLNGSAIAGPPSYYNLASYQFWIQRFASARHAHSKRCLATAIANDPTLPAIPPHYGLVWVGTPPIDVAAASYLLKNHLGGLFDSSPEERIRLLIKPMFAPLTNTDSLSFAGYSPTPDSIFFWDAAYFYLYDLLSQKPIFSNSYANALINARYGFERCCLGVPMTPTGSPIGSSLTNGNGRLYSQGPASTDMDGTNAGIHINWFYNWTMPTVPWYQGAVSGRWPESTIWHDYTEGGSQLPDCPDGSPRSLFGEIEDGHFLVPYLKDSQYSPITGHTVLQAFMEYTCDYLIRQAEEMRRIVDEFQPEPFV